MSVYVEGEVVEELHKRRLNLSQTTELALRHFLGMPDKVDKKEKSEVPRR